MIFKQSINKIKQRFKRSEFHYIIRNTTIKNVKIDSILKKKEYQRMFPDMIIYDLIERFKYALGISTVVKFKSGIFGQKDDIYKELFNNTKTEVNLLSIELAKEVKVKDPNHKNGEFRVIIDYTLTTKPEIFKKYEKILKSLELIDFYTKSQKKTLILGNSEIYALLQYGAVPFHNKMAGQHQNEIKLFPKKGSELTIYIDWVVIRNRRNYYGDLKDQINPLYNVNLSIVKKIESII